MHCSNFLLLHKKLAQTGLLNNTHIFLSHSLCEPRVCGHGLVGSSVSESHKVIIKIFAGAQPMWLSGRVLTYEPEDHNLIPGQGTWQGYRLHPQRWE